MCHFLRDDEAGCVRFETAKVGYFGKWRPKYGSKVTAATDPRVVMTIMTFFTVINLKAMKIVMFTKLQCCLPKRDLNKAKT